MKLGNDSLWVLIVVEIQKEQLILCYSTLHLLVYLLTLLLFLDWVPNCLCENVSQVDFTIQLSTDSKGFAYSWLKVLDSHRVLRGADDKRHTIHISGILKRF